MFALRYASSGSNVKVFVLHTKDGNPSLASEFKKKGTVPYQTPGCAQHGGNGFKLPPFIQIPIEKARLDSSGLDGWNEAQVDIMNMLGAKKWPTPPQGEDHAMLSEELEVEETQIDQSFFDCNHA